MIDFKKADKVSIIDSSGNTIDGIITEIEQHKGYKGYSYQLIYVKIDDTGEVKNCFPWNLMERKTKKEA